MFIGNDLIDNGLLVIRSGMPNQTHTPGLVPFTYNRSGLETTGESFDIGVRQGNDRLGASEILQHIID